MAGQNQAHYSGSAMEFLAASWFLDRGWQVWWPSVQQDGVDFAISKNGKFRKIQVKKATWNRSGQNEYLQLRVQSAHRKYDADDFHYLVIVDAPRMWKIPFREVRDKTSLCLDKRGPTSTKGRYTEYVPDKWRIA